MISRMQNSLNFLQKRVITVDVETTTTNKGHPFTLNNKCVTIQVKVDDEPTKVFTNKDFGKVRAILESASLVVGTNIKFDLHWLQRETGFQANAVWDLQLAEFLFSDQLWTYPDLNGMCEKYDIPQKVPIVKEEYWDKGIDTDMIPIEILAEYGAHDVDITYAVFKKQLEIFKTEREHQFLLFRAHCNDLLVLQEMEWNGILYDVQASLTEAENLTAVVEKIDANLQQEYGHGIPINFNSRDDISVLLYGGVISVTTRLPIGTYKTGAKIGETRYKVLNTDHTLPRLVEPLKNSALKKEGFYSTDADTLVSLKPDKHTRKLITKLLERAKVKKLQSTYLTGFPKIIGVMQWENEVIHSNLNQCSVVTGRLSSTKPNIQNQPKESKRHCISRY